MEADTVPQVRAMAMLAGSIRGVGKAATDVNVALKGVVVVTNDEYGFDGCRCLHPTRMSTGDGSARTSSPPAYPPVVVYEWSWHFCAGYGDAGVSKCCGKNMLVVLSETSLFCCSADCARCLRACVAWGTWRRGVGLLKSRIKRGLAMSSPLELHTLLGIRAKHCLQ